MKLLRYGPPGQEQPGILDSVGDIRSLKGIVDDIAGDTLSHAGLDKLRKLDHNSLPAVEKPTRIGPPVGRVGKFIGIGLNYSEHAAETGADVGWDAEDDDTCIGDRGEVGEPRLLDVGRGDGRVEGGRDGCAARVVGAAEVEVALEGELLGASGRDEVDTAARGAQEEAEFVEGRARRGHRAPA